MTQSEEKYWRTFLEVFEWCSGVVVDEGLHVVRLSSLYKSIVTSVRLTNRKSNSAPHSICGVTVNWPDRARGSGKTQTGSAFARPGLASSHYGTILRHSLTKYAMHPESSPGASRAGNVRA